MSAEEYAHQLLSALERIDNEQNIHDTYDDAVAADEQTCSSRRRRR